MINNVLDQAEGLRRLLGKNVVRTITIASGMRGVGKTNVAINLASALAHTGKKVLLIDENIDQHNVNAILGLRARYDFLHAINDDKDLQDVVIQSSDEITVLPAARAAQQLPNLSASKHQRFIACFDRLLTATDIVIVDTAQGQDSRLASFHRSNQEILIVVNPDPVSITTAYALIKKLHLQSSVQDFRVLVNKVASEGEAGLVFGNLAQVANDYLNVRLQLGGFVNPDPKLHLSAGLRRTVIEAYPNSSSASCFRRVANAITQWIRPTDDGLKNFMQRVVQDKPLEAANYIL